MKGGPMFGLSGIAIFWLIALGLITGITFGLVVRKEGVSVPANIFFFSYLLCGTVGSFRR